MAFIYLDYNRTTPLAPSVLEAMQPYWATHFMLPGQEHPHAQAVSEALESAREGVAMLAGCDPFELVFTGGGTEANNLAVLGFLSEQEPGHVLVSELEHDSILGVAESLRRRRWRVELVPCQTNGVVDPEQFASRLQPDTRLACLQLANPVLGTLQPVRDVADLCHNRGVPLHCDATQVFGKMPVDVVQLRADTVSISGHKFYGPKGCGAIYVRRGLRLSPIAFGEPREMGLRPGAENIPGCIGLGAAATLAGRCSADASESLARLRDRFIQRVQEVVTPTPRVLCQDAARLPNTIAMEMPCDARQLQRAARTLVVATAQSDTPPDEMTRTLVAIGKSDVEIKRTVRVSLGWTSSSEQVDRAADLLAEACDGLTTA